VPVEDITI